MTKLLSIYTRIEKSGTQFRFFLYLWNINQKNRIFIRRLGIPGSSAAFPFLQGIDKFALETALEKVEDTFQRFYKKQNGCPTGTTIKKATISRRGVGYYEVSLALETLIERSSLLYRYTPDKYWEWISAFTISIS